MKDILVMDLESSRTFWSSLETDFPIRYAASACEGLSMLSDKTGIAFISLTLPDMHGLEVLQKVKSLHPSTSVIIMTATGTEETCIEAFRRGARDYLKKPLLACEIRQKIDLIMETRDSGCQRRYISMSANPDLAGQHHHMPMYLLHGVIRVRDYISENYADPLSLSAACRMSSLSRTYFCRFFKRVTGHTMRHYQHMVRVRVAKELLQNRRLTVTDIAMRLGYDDPNYFSAIYKKLTGSSPRNRHSRAQASCTDRLPAVLTENCLDGMHQPERIHGHTLIDKGHRDKAFDCSIDKSKKRSFPMSAAA